MAFWSRLRSAVPPRRAVAAASVAAGALTTYSLPNTVFADAMDTSETSVAIHNSNMGKNVLGDKLLRGKTIAEASEELWPRVCDAPDSGGFDFVLIVVDILALCSC